MVKASERKPEHRDVSRSPAVFMPLYRQIKGLLLQSLDRGEWKPGASIPSEMELAGCFHVSQGTVRKAIDELAAENLLVRKQGKGTFVATHHEPQVRFRFLKIFPDAGEPIAAKSFVLECRRLRAPSDVARLLQLATGDSLVYIRRLLSFADKPLVLDDIWLPAALFKGLTAEVLAAHQGPLYGLFETRFGIQMIRADEKIRAVNADAGAAILLKVRRDAPLLLVERLTSTYAERPVEVRRGLCITAEHHYRNTLT